MTSPDIKRLRALLAAAPAAESREEILALLDRLEEAETRARRLEEVVRGAVEELLADEGDFARTISSLCGLVGLRYPAGEVEIESVGVCDVLAALAAEEPE